MQRYDTHTLRGFSERASWLLRVSVHGQGQFKTARTHARRFHTGRRVSFSADTKEHDGTRLVTRGVLAVVERMFYNKKLHTASDLCEILLAVARGAQCSSSVLPTLHEHVYLHLHELVMRLKALPPSTVGGRKRMRQRSGMQDNGATDDCAKRARCDDAGCARVSAADRCPPANTDGDEDVSWTAREPTVPVLLSGGSSTHLKRVHLPLMVALVQVHYQFLQTVR